MAKYPRPGTVKTRLAVHVGPQAACRIYRAFVLDLAARLARASYPVTWAFWPSDAPFATLLPGARTRPQRGADLGERLADAIGECLKHDARPVLAIGADAPHVPLHAFSAAAAALHRGADVVLGPATDGGYYLLGGRRLPGSLLGGIPWSRDAVLPATLARAHRAGLRVRLLPVLSDVDTWEDLVRLRAALARGELVLPHSAAAIARLSSDGPA